MKERTREGANVWRGTRLKRGKGGKGESRKPMSNSEGASSSWFSANSGLDSTEDDEESRPWRVGVLGEIERAANCAVGRMGRFCIR